MFELNDSLSPHLVASVLKKYLRDRPFATVPYWCYRSAVLIHESLPDKNAPYSADECKNFVGNLPSEKQVLFIAVVRYLKRLAVHEPETKMGVNNLAIVFAPVLMRSRGDGLLLFSENDRQTDFLARIIDLVVCDYSSQRVFQHTSTFTHSHVQTGRALSARRGASAGAGAAARIGEAAHSRAAAREEAQAQAPRQGEGGQQLGQAPPPKAQQVEQAQQEARQQLCAATDRVHRLAAGRAVQVCHRACATRLLRPRRPVRARARGRV